ncbi:cytochrome C oxidase subunit I [Streptomyces brasiliensis]|uniref:Cytochrome C oxidase subunit I n=1 Tax=Streptomyces brasiliensis TaxID=1954 RepID=A0A917ULA4_9ACTN|nr:cytochrome C oxidase subunit I [Streptomyces brasiliensis]GGJ65988.1 hypothetical protein GCM10010121_090900 [Streptomyces brasiliensis]
MSDLSKRKAEGVGLGDEAEGYLLWQATIMVAEQRAREFVRPMEWLTTAQRTAIEEQYVSDSLHHAQKDLERIAARCLSLRGEYEQRYRRLRLRCVGWVLAACAGFTSVVTLSLIR